MATGIRYYATWESGVARAGIRALFEASIEWKLNAVRTAD